MLYVILIIYKFWYDKFKKNGLLTNDQQNLISSLEMNQIDQVLPHKDGKFCTLRVWQELGPMKNY